MISTQALPLWTRIEAIYTASDGQRWVLWRDGVCVHRDQYGMVRQRAPHQKYFW